MALMERPTFGPIDFKTRFTALDGIRALAVTIVFLGHYGGGSHGGGALQAFNRIRLYGHIGVDVFFVLSGFLITGILFDTRFDSKFFSRFFGRRTVRIFPVVYLVFLVVLLLTPIFHFQWRWQHATFLLYLGNFFGNADFSIYELRAANPAWNAYFGHLWSLCVEEQFYFIWPAVVWFVKDRVKLVWLTAGVSVFTLLLRAGMCLVVTPHTAETWIVRTLPFRLDDLMFGALLALLLRGPAADKVQRSMKWLFWGGMIGFILVSRYSAPSIGFGTLTIGMTAIGLASMGLIGATLHPTSIAHRIFNVRAFRVLGKYSYGFYVWHLIWWKAWIQLLVVVMAKTHSVLLGGLVELPLAFATTFLVAKLSYDLFEVRFLRLKRRWEYDTELITHKTAFDADGN
jgi:peptidoglycan/LPS O-acetylase OafA/YrhL